MTWGLWIKGARASGAKYEGYHGCQSTTGKWWTAEPDSESMLLFRRERCRRIHLGLRGFGQLKRPFITIYNLDCVSGSDVLYNITLFVQ